MDDPVAPAKRRMIIRRSRGGGGFTPSVSTNLRALPGAEHQEEDEIDDEIRPENIRERIRREVRRGEVPLPDTEAIKKRLDKVTKSGSSAYAKEYRLQIMHGMLMANVPLDEIAKQLQVSIRTVEYDRKLLKQRMREAAQQLNIEEIVGTQTAEYDHISGLALAMATDKDTREAMKLAAMRTALAAKADKNRFYHTAGVYDVLRFRRAEDGSDVSDVQTLMQRTMELMESLNSPDTPATPKAPKGTPTKKQGFTALTYEDDDASGSAQEIQEI